MRRIAKLLLGTLAFRSLSAQADVLEERNWQVISEQVRNPFQLNPAALATSETVVSLMQLTGTEEAKYIFNPNNNAAKVEHKTKVKDIALGTQYPLGGAAVGFVVDQYDRVVKAKHENRGSAVEENFSLREYKMNFAIDLISELQAAFSFRYQTLESDLFGSHFLSNEDKTHYEGNRSGYAIGGLYQLKSMGIGVYTARPLRGKATIEGEQKIISDPGYDGLDFGLDLNERIKLKLSALRWTYKRDDRDDDSTSPVDQRGILLRGLEIDQYYRKTQALGLGGEFLLTPVVAIKASWTMQKGVFLFDSKALPGQKENLETSMNYGDLKGGVSVRNREFMVELMFSRYQREKDTINVGRGDVGLNQLGSYEASRYGVLLNLGAAF